MEEREKLENKEITIDIFESIQIDFKPEKPKKRRNYDDYDYNDPFIESFEGEFEAVDLECKLENFFIFKGKITEDPKRIARRYNNSLKKNPLIETIHSSILKENEDKKNKLFFAFEKRLINSISPSYKYKKDLKFDNFIFWVIFIEEPQNEFQKILREKLLAFYHHKEFNKNEFLNKNTAEIDLLKTTVEDQFNELQTKVSLDCSYSEDRKIFKLFSDIKYVEKMINFVIGYMKFYAVSTDDKLSHVKNSALDYVSAMLPEQCTNGIKVKHYISKVLSMWIEEQGYDLDSVKNGNFIKNSQLSNIQAQDSILERSQSLDALSSSSKRVLCPDSDNKNSISQSMDYLFTQSISSEIKNSEEQYIMSANTKPIVKTKKMENTEIKNSPLPEQKNKIGKKKLITTSEEQPESKKLRISKASHKNSNLNEDNKITSNLIYDLEKSEDEDMIQSQNSMEDSSNVKNQLPKKQPGKKKKINADVSNSKTDSITPIKTKGFSYPTVPVFARSFNNKIPAKTGSAFVRNNLSKPVVPDYSYPIGSQSLGSSIFNTDEIMSNSREFPQERVIKSNLNDVNYNFNTNNQLINSDFKNPNYVQNKMNDFIYSPNDNSLFDDMNSHANLNHSNSIISNANLNNSESLKSSDFLFYSQSENKPKELDTYSNNQVDNQQTTQLDLKPQKKRGRKKKNPEN